MAKSGNRSAGNGSSKASKNPASANSPAAQDQSTPSVASQLPPVSPEEVEAARKKFEQGIVSRGEAVEAGKPLPPGATHEIVGQHPDGTPILKRSRFSYR